jgi:hypothetical protein
VWPYTALAVDQGTERITSMGGHRPELLSLSSHDWPSDRRSYRQQAHSSAAGTGTPGRDQCRHYCDATLSVGHRVAPPCSHYSKPIGLRLHAPLVGATCRNQTTSTTDRSTFRPAQEAGDPTTHAEQPADADGLASPP